MTTDTPPQDTGRGGARRRRAVERGGGAAQPPAGQPHSPFAPLDLVSRDELESIHQAALEVLKEIGIDFLHDEARSMLKEAGADVDPASRRVRFDPALVEAHIGLAPKEFVLHARNPARDLKVGGRHVAFGSVASAPNSFDRAGGRRPGNKHDYQNFIRLGQSFESIHFWGGYPVEPIDVHASIRHLEALFDMLTLSDKPIHAYSLGRERNLDAIEMVKIARGVDDETLEREPSLFTVINSSSPLRLDTPMLEGIIQMARRNQVVVLTPFTLAGAMAPVTLAGALAQQHAEALAGLVMTQVVRPCAPFVYGGFTSNVDMKSGAPAFGTPEYMKTAIVGGQLARRLGLPYRSSNTNAANSLDAQAAYESVFSLWGAIMGGANFLMHGAGWMEGGLLASFEKMTLDADLLAMVAEFLKPLRVDEAELALEAMREVGPGGHFFGAEHTQSRYRTAFFPPMISDWRNYETWREAGSPTALDAAERIVAQRLRDFVAPPLEAERLEALVAFVARRKAEGGAPTDF
jgi:trimethylamine--corrinoid protein Co-methyltransferase